MSRNLMNNRLSVTVSEETITSIKAKIDEITALLPFLIGLTPDERVTLPKVSKSNKLFVDDAISSMENMPEILPNYLDPQEIRKDYDLYRQLSNVSLIIDELAEKINDTRMLAGSEAYAASLMAYRMYKAATESGIPGAESTYQRLQERFAGQGSTKTTPEESQETPPANADEGTS